MLLRGVQDAVVQITFMGEGESKEQRHTISEFMIWFGTTRAYFLSGSLWMYQLSGRFELEITPAHEPIHLLILASGSNIVFRVSGGNN